MITAKGYAAQEAKAPLTPFSFERRDVGDKDVLIDIHYCGICHSDIHQAREEWGPALFPMVPGHEIVGIVSKVGPEVTKFKAGDIVGVGCFVDSCRRCEPCTKHLEQFCAETPTTTYNCMERDGSKLTQGGYSTCIVTNEDFVLHIPDNLSMAGAAPLLCAGITLYSPLKHWQAGPNKKVAIVGLGGLGHMGIKLAHAMQAEVSVLSHSPSKEEDAKRLGADKFFALNSEQAFRNLHNSYDLIINTVSAPLDWNKYLQLLKLDGAMVVVGVPERNIPISAATLISNRRSLSGSLVGGIQETQEMLDFCSKHNITADIEIIPIQQVNEAYERVLKSDVRYRFVIDIASLKNT
ncbi:oxidoreductase, Zn-dependent and NAD(P)-binding [Legionella beliardensis]|uniref:Oxidoreductase, Zn-dependent and NAD(P)-binding n=1 Tax=Legionella beliardensis TaxID=91822 RepID=A0A378I4Z9_9GAMM|nr:NAD(P)-dependent alcohol dehydrogenase [Legionella beliardensis]STX29922.1 oxidoreductase, Zn-dependent and NAD(P)-binding [Legionella beliardensis]